ncbi:GNAT family N-acetyltransferase [Paenibacillus macerans]|uniref:GNAT family N-acetyltransferase n=1 Tax=Paenibacillus macerans TaxID=44252 RepID=UPI002E1DE0C8|nr:GNAT family N-acetyltransferase [Paenibacillus macerans]MED4953615.1 GNAT family N-acetyltransferase [Paenibacillus macerans]
MILLNVRDYKKAEKPLREVGFNTLFAESVIHGNTPGQVYADDEANPSVFYVAHPYGMSLLFGAADKPGFNQWLQQYLLDKARARSGHEWLQAYPADWNGRIRQMLGSELVVRSTELQEEIAAASPKAVEYTRVNFRFERDKYRIAAKPANLAGYEIVRTTKEMFLAAPGAVVPRFFWKDEVEFERMGVGFSLICEGEIAATAFSAFITEKELEIGIETAEKYRGRGFAAAVCSALIDYCLWQGLGPVWSCRRENEGSYRLAQKLGFVPSLMIPYYRLPAGAM